MNDEWMTTVYSSWDHAEFIMVSGQWPLTVNSVGEKRETLDAIDRRMPRYKGETALPPTAPDQSRRDHKHPADGRTC